MLDFRHRCNNLADQIGNGSSSRAPSLGNPHTAVPNVMADTGTALLRLLHDLFLRMHHDQSGNHSDQKHVPL